MAEFNDYFQPELDLGITPAPTESTEDQKRPTKRKVSFPTELESSLNDIWDKLTLEGITLEPKDSEDPFYKAQLRARELETLQNLDGVPILNEGLPFQQELAMSALLGIRARDELNQAIPQEVRNKRLAFSTFTLTALKRPSLRQVPLEDDEIVVTGLFNGFSFETYSNKETIIIPLMDPWIRNPRFLRGVELASAKIPVLSIDDWKWTIPRN